MKKALFFLTAMILITVFLAGCSAEENAVERGIINETIDTEIDSSERAVKENAEESKNITIVIDNRNSTSGNVTDNREPRTQKQITVSDEDFDISGYLYENSIGNSLYFLIVKNNSPATVSFGANGIAKDGNGNIIGADDMSIDVLGPGEESIGYFYFTEVSGIETVDYEIFYDTSSWYYPVIGNLRIDQTLNNSNVTLSVTNNGSICAQFVEAYALFLDEAGKVIHYDSAYITDGEYEIKPGKTLSAQLNSRKYYDSVVIALTGRSDGSTSESSNCISKDELDVETHLYENSIGNSMFFMAITNNSSETVGITANGIAKDAVGNEIGADNAEIDVLGAGEQSIAYFYFNDVKDIAEVEYDLSCKTDIYYSAVIADLEMQETINDRNVIVSIKNNGMNSAEFVKAHALFFDASGNVVYYDSAYVVDDDNEIKPGKTLVKQLDSRYAFDTVQVYLTGRHHD